MAYMTFTDALMQTKRASQLRGIPFSTRDFQNLHSSYMSGAAERVSGERSAALSEKTLSSQQENFATALAQEKELSGTALTQAKGLSEKTLTQEKEISAVGLTQKAILSEKALAQERTLSGTSLAAQREMETSRATAAREAQVEALAQEKELFGLSQEQARQEATAQIDAQESASQKALVGNVASTGLGLGGAAWLLAPAAKTGAAAAGAAAGKTAAAWLTGAGATVAPPAVASGAGMAAAPFGFGATATGMGTLGTAATVAGVIAAPYLAYRALGGGKDEGTHLSQLTPEQFANQTVTYHQHLDQAQMTTFGGNENFSPKLPTPAAAKALWIESYNNWFTGMKKHYGQDVPKTMSADEAWDLKNNIWGNVF